MKAPAVSDKIRIFVGCAPNHDDAESQMVLEYSLRRHTSRALEITWMKLSRAPASPFSGWNTSTWATPFTGFRWAVPYLCGFEGKAIYTDSDVIARADVGTLFDLPLTAGVAGKSDGRLCVSLWNCAVAPRLTLSDLRNGVRWSPIRQNFPVGEEWNCLDVEKYSDIYDPRIKAIHYTSMPHQPHLPLATTRLGLRGRKHWFDGKQTPHWRKDLIDLFMHEYFAALAADYTVEQYCRDPLYGDYQKGSVASLNGTIPHWGR